MDFRQVESFDKPLLEDDKASPFGAYIRQNVVEEEYTNEEGETKIRYTYDEAFISFEEYKQYQATKYAIDTAEQKREADIIDDYTLQLIDEGVIG